MLVNTLREWRLACPKGDLTPSSHRIGAVWQYLSDIIQRGFWRAEIAAGVTDEAGKPKIYRVTQPARLLRLMVINRCIDGGLELPLELVESRLGHSTVNMTADVYGHLFPRGDDGAELAAAEKVYLS